MATNAKWEYSSVLLEDQRVIHYRNPNYTADGANGPEYYEGKLTSQSDSLAHTGTRPNQLENMEVVNIQTADGTHKSFIYSMRSVFARGQDGAPNYDGLGIEAIEILEDPDNPGNILNKVTGFTTENGAGNQFTGKDFTNSGGERDDGVDALGYINYSDNTSYTETEHFRIGDRNYLATKYYTQTGSNMGAPTVSIHEIDDNGGLTAVDEWILEDSPNTGKLSTADMYRHAQSFKMQVVDSENGTFIQMMGGTGAKDTPGYASMEIKGTGFDRDTLYQSQTTTYPEGDTVPRSMQNIETLKDIVTVTDSAGNDHYYSIYNSRFSDRGIAAQNLRTVEYRVNSSGQLEPVRDTNGEVIVQDTGVRAPRNAFDDSYNYIDADGNYRTQYIVSDGSGIDIHEVRVDTDGTFSLERIEAIDGTSNISSVDIIQQKSSGYAISAHYNASRNEEAVVVYNVDVDKTVTAGGEGIISDVTEHAQTLNGDHDLNIVANSSAAYESVVTLQDGTVKTLTIYPNGASRIAGENINDPDYERGAASSWGVTTVDHDLKEEEFFFPIRGETGGEFACFAKGTHILTPKGKVLIEELRAGDKVLTKDHGEQSIRWIGSSVSTSVSPIVFKKGAWGNDRDLLVSPAHRMVVSGWRADVLFGTSEVLVSAADLVNGETIYHAQARETEYFHILFEQHEIIYSEGAPTESYHPNPSILSEIDSKTRDEILALFPELRTNTEAYGRTARQVISTHDAFLLTN